MKVVLVAALVLGAIERHVGLHQHDVRSAAALNKRTDADADRNPHIVTVDSIGSRERCLELGCKYPGVRRLTHFPLEYGELVATQPGYQVALPRALPQALGNFPQEQVADRVTQRVVDWFEVIEIEIENCKRGGAALGGGKRLAESFNESRAVRQPGETVCASKQRNFLLRRLALGNVDDDAFDFNEPTLFIANRDVAVFDPSASAITGAQAKFDRGTFGVLLQYARHRRADFCLVCGLDKAFRPARRRQQGSRIVSQLDDVV